LVPSGSSRAWRFPMPIYLVKWDGENANKPELVRAQNSAHLFEIVDEHSDPYGAKYRRYSGPLAIEFQMGEEEESTGEGDKVELCPTATPAESHSSDERYAMTEALVKLLSSPRGWHHFTDGDNFVERMIVERDKALTPTPP